MLNLKDETLCIVSPHPDDEILGCGGLAKRVKDAGGKVHVLFMTLGDTVEYSKSGSSKGSERMREIEEAAAFMKYDSFDILFPGNQYHLRLDTVAELDVVGKIEKALNTLKPTIVAFPQPHDYNQDHRATARAVITATRPAPDDGKPFQRTVLGYESVPVADWGSGHPMSPNFYVDLSKEDLAFKLEALALYRSQIRTGAHARSLRSMENLAYYRGMQCGAMAAEAFECYRNFIKA